MVFQLLIDKSLKITEKEIPCLEVTLLRIVLIGQMQRRDRK